MTDEERARGYVQKNFGPSWEDGNRVQQLVAAFAAVRAEERQRAVRICRGLINEVVGVGFEEPWYVQDVIDRIEQEDA